MSKRVPKYRTFTHDNNVLKYISPVPIVEPLDLCQNQVRSGKNRLSTRGWRSHGIPKFSDSVQLTYAQDCGNKLYLLIDWFLRYQFYWLIDWLIDWLRYHRLICVILNNRTGVNPTPCLKVDTQRHHRRYTTRLLINRTITTAKSNQNIGVIFGVGCDEDILHTHT